MKAERITNCRFCGGALDVPFCDLGATPLANSFVPPERAGEPDPVFPLNAMACGRCQLVQLDHTADATGIFSDYAYFSSFSSTWLRHAAAFCADATARFGIGAQSLVVEIASNDGYLLRNFVAAGIPCLGVEPAGNVAAAAEAAGVPTRVAFFGRDEAARIVAERGHADLVIANNVLAHVPDVNDFVAGLARLAGPHGVVSIEAPHLLALIEGLQFDTIYHEHFFYWSLHSMAEVLGAHGLAVMRVEALPTHGGSLRVTAARRPWGDPGARDAVHAREIAARLDRAEGYAGFGARVGAVLDGLRAHLAAMRGRRVAAYGAAAKGNTLLNAAGVTAAAIAMVADRNPAKQGRLLPGSRIPVVTPEALLAFRPEEVLILPWNIVPEIAGELRALRERGGRLIVAVPELRAVPFPP
jgi:SAM-dependent methyltransferase